MWKLQGLYYIKDVTDVNITIQMYENYNLLDGASAQFARQVKQYLMKGFQFSGCVGLIGAMVVLVALKDLQTSLN